MSFHVVVGAGATGAELARLLAEAGDTVRLVSRRGLGPQHPRIERVAADANDSERLVALTRGAATLFNCAMPPYDRWPEEWPPLAASLLRTAERTQAAYVMLGNVYGYGPATKPLTEDLPLRATTRKGRVRTTMWLDALEAHRQGRVRAVEVRAADFLGHGAVSLFTLMIAPGVRAGERIAFPADLDAPHSWTSTVDAARTLAAVSRRPDAFGQPWHVPSTVASVREVTRKFAGLVGAPSPRLEAMPAAQLAELAAANSMMAELPEMAYLWDAPFVLDAARTERELGITATPLDEVLRETART